MPQPCRQFIVEGELGRGRGRGWLGWNGLGWDGAWGVQRVRLVPKYLSRGQVAEAERRWGLPMGTEACTVRGGLQWVGGWGQQYTGVQKTGLHAGAGSALVLVHGARGLLQRAPHPRMRLGMCMAWAPT